MTMTNLVNLHVEFKLTNHKTLQIIILPLLSLQQYWVEISSEKDFLVAIHIRFTSEGSDGDPKDL